METCQNSVTQLKLRPADVMTLFFALHLILGEKLGFCGRDDLFLLSTKFSKELFCSLRMKRKCGRAAKSNSLNSVIFAELELELKKIIFLNLNSLKIVRVH